METSQLERLIGLAADTGQDIITVIKEKSPEIASQIVSSGIAINLSLIIIFIIIILIIWKVAIPKIHNTDRTSVDAMAFVGTVCTVLLIVLSINSLYELYMAIFAPDLYVLNYIKDFLIK